MCQMPEFDAAGVQVGAQWSQIAMTRHLAVGLSTCDYEICGLGRIVRNTVSTHPLAIAIDAA